MRGIPPFFSAIHGQIRRFGWANTRRGRNCECACYLSVMELLLIIIGGILTTAIISMMIDWVRGHVLDDDINPFDHSFDDRGSGQDLGPKG